MDLLINKSKQRNNKRRRYSRSTKQLAHKFGLLYAGTSKKSVIENIRNQLEMGAWIVHNQAGINSRCS